MIGAIRNNLICSHVVSLLPLFRCKHGQENPTLFQTPKHIESKLRKGDHESGSFWFYSCSVRSFQPGSFRQDFWGESFRPSWGGRFGPIS